MRYLTKHLIRNAEMSQIENPKPVDFVKFFTKLESCF